MILVLGDIHAEFHLMKELIKLAVKEWSVEAVVQVGDFGIFHPYYRKLTKIPVPLYFVEGNHEDFGLLEKLRKGKPGIATIAHNVFHVVRGCSWEMAGLKWTGLGGCEMFDRPNCPPGSTPTDEEIQKTADGGKTDILVTHDGPFGLEIPGHPMFGGGFDVGSKRFTHLYRLEPKIWFFGHHHQVVQRELRGVRHYGMDCATRGYGLFDPRTLQVAWKSYNRSLSREGESHEDAW